MPEVCHRLSNSTPTGIRRGRRASGFTIFEAMMAAAIMSLAIATSITTMQRAFLSLDTARNLTIAGQIMANEVEKMRMADWTTVSAYAAGPTTITIDSSFTSVASIGSRMALSRSAATVGGNANLLQLTYTITWNSYDGRPISRSYSTYYSRYGIHDYLYTTT